MSSWKDSIEARFDTLYSTSVNKEMPLGEAVRTFIKPGMKLNPCGIHSRPGAAIYELCRQFQGTDPQFEYMGLGLTATMLPLVHLKLIKKGVVSFAGDGYPTPGPSPVIVRALKRGEIELENWTMLTICQRLMAGAMSVPFITTRSLIGSTLASELPHAFREMQDPFSETGATGVVSAYHPDISFVHTWASDPAGNALCFPPLVENIYGPLAARTGVVLTAEHIVDTDFIRRYAHLGRIPAEKVLSVSHAPYGAHPGGYYTQGVPECISYGHDYDFLKEHRAVQVDEGAYQRWVEEWIRDVADHDAYVHKLGLERINKLHAVAMPQSWRPEFDHFCRTVRDNQPAGAIERMVIQTSREILKRIPLHHYSTVLCGIGQATLATILAWRALHDRGQEFAAMAEIGIYNYDPRPADPFVFNYRNMPTATMLSDIFEILGLHMGGDSNQCLGLLGAAQIDRRGNVNSVRMGGHFIVGSGGANDVATAARETIVIAQQNKGQFVRDVEHITCPGTRVRCVVTTRGRFEKIQGDELVLTGYMAQEGVSEEDTVRVIKDLVDWDLRVGAGIERLEMPTDTELMLLRSYDPERFFIGKSAE